MPTLEEVRNELKRRRQLEAVREEIARRKGIAGKMMQERSGDQAFAPSQPEPSLSGVGDVAATLATGAVAEPLAGLAGIAQAINPLAEEGAGAEAVESVRGALTRDLTPEGAAILSKAVGAVPESVMDFGGNVLEGFNATADFVAENFGPAAGAAVKTAPVAAMELIGFKGAQSLLRSSKQAARVGTRAVKRGIRQSAPSAQELKLAARGLFRELDNSGAVIKGNKFNKLIDDIVEAAADQGVDIDVTPKSFRVLQRFKDRAGTDVPLTELDTLRKVAQGAARSLDPPDANVGRAIIEHVDEFLDSLDSSALATGKAADVGQKFRVARELWGRARRSEMLMEAFENARNQASGFENGIRTQLRSILRNKKKARFFTPDERELMSKVVQGTKGQNLAKLIGRLGPGEGGATNLVGLSIGVFGGTSVGGPVGGVAMPIIGSISRKLAQRLTRANAEFLDDVIRAGRDGKKIIVSYFRHTPKAQRDPAELAQLLLRPDIALPESQTQLVRQAVSLTRRTRDIAQSAVGLSGAVLPTLQRETQQAQQVTQ